MKNKKVLIATTALAGFIAVAEPAWSQEDAVSEIVITGTRLRLPDYVLANPVTSVTAETLTASGQVSLTEALLDMPALVGSLDDAIAADTTTAGDVGLNLLDLRNLGTARTLVLVNGRRHVSSDPGTSAVDTNAIPIALVERIEILTGGASAVYGADGVSGVVNFILKTNYEGLSVRAQYGGSQQGGRQSKFVSVLGGKNFFDGRANVIVGGELNLRDPVKFNDRAYTFPGKRKIRTRNIAERLRDDPLIPDFILASGTTYIDTSPGGSIATRNPEVASGLGGFDFLGDGSPFINGQYVSGFFAIGGSGSLLDQFNDDLLPGGDIYSLFANSTFELSSSIQLFSELKYTQSTYAFEAQPTYDYGLFIPIDNPLIPANIVADFRDAQAAGEDIASYYGLPDGVLVARDNFDFGRNRYDIERKTARAVFGARGALTSFMDYELSYVYGQSKLREAAYNVRLNDRFFAATDVVTGPNGQLTCRSNLDPTAVPIGDFYSPDAFDAAYFGATFTPGANSGCVPANIFGEGNLSQEAIDFFTTSQVSTSKIDQEVITAFIRGDSSSLFTLPTGGAVSYVLGGEYRRETSSYSPDSIRLLAADLDYPINFLGSAAKTEGAYQVKEAFLELSAPVLRDLPFIKELELSGAYRYSKYSTAGETDTWNVAAKWRVNDTFMLRGTVAKAVRAPNIVNLFRGREETSASLADPCQRENQALGEQPAIRAQNCAADLASLGIADPANFNNTVSDSTRGAIAGNPFLRPENADTITAGFVYTPSYVPGLSVSVDYYDIEITDAIQSYSAQTILNNCYDLPRPNQFCSLISRQATGPFVGRIDTFDQVPGNIASYLTSGVDFTARYRFVPSRFGIERDIGTFDFSLAGNWLNELVFVEDSTAAPNEDTGEMYVPEFQLNFGMTWNYANWGVNYGFTYFSETKRFADATIDAQPDYMDPRYFKYHARNEHDIQVDYRADNGATFYAGVNNFTNQRPEFDDYIYPVSPQGRFMYVGLRFELK